MQRTTSMTGLGRTAAGALTAVLMAAGVVALAPSAQAAAGQDGPQASAAQRPAAESAAANVPLVAADRSTKVTLSNGSGSGLTKTWDKLDHGCWTNDMLPSDYIPNTKSSSWQSESCGFATGTEGNITYTLDNGGEVKLHWNNPYWGSNDYSCSVPDGYTCSRSGGSGDNTAVTFSIGRSRAKAAAAEMPSLTSASRSTSINLTNNSGKLLTRSGASLQWGIWSDNMMPPSMVQPGVTAKWASESEGVMTGTEGEVSFNVAGEQNQVKVHWNNPYWGSNGYSCDAPAGYKCTWQGGSGDNAAVSFTLSKS
ncbi:Crystal protein ET79 [Kitasatospora xanthocidica]|uniref:Crystal protein ET79 n=1 Tax=Kitasatospora xanthocidica TaxID=83382 RepID=A0A372ZQZ2_9ACTN|nr:aegerolysin family protein [Kitasatospora xanthocidica]RGD58263.1 Crystal protein ET79 [Kitasatospora xanthocidica]